MSNLNKFVHRTRCLGQEYVKGSETLAGGSNVGERLGRVEQLLETLVAKISAYEDKGIMTPESTGTDDVLTPYPSSVLSDAQIQETAPFLSLFNNTAVSAQPFQPSKLGIFLISKVWAPTKRSVSGFSSCLTKFRNHATISWK
jgi:hypothetical protein